MSQTEEPIARFFVFFFFLLISGAKRSRWTTRRARSRGDQGTNSTHYIKHTPTYRHTSIVFVLTQYKAIYFAIYREKRAAQAWKELRGLL